MKVDKGNLAVVLIRKIFSYLDGPLYKKLFTTFVRPHLEYGQVIWTPHLIYNYSGKCATLKRKIGGWFLSHELLRKLKKTESTIVESIIYSRARGDMIEISKHFHSYEIVR